MLKELPDDPVDYMLKYIKENLGDKASKHRNERIELELLRKEVKGLEELKKGLMEEYNLEEAPEGEDGEEEVEEEKGGSEEHSSEDDEHDMVEDLPIA